MASLRGPSGCSIGGRDPRVGRSGRAGQQGHALMSRIRRDGSALFTLDSKSLDESGAELAQRRRQSQKSGIGSSIAQSQSRPHTNWRIRAWRGHVEHDGTTSRAAARSLPCHNRIVRVIGSCPPLRWNRRGLPCLTLARIATHPTPSRRLREPTRQYYLCRECRSAHGVPVEWEGEEPEGTVGRAAQKFAADPSDT